MLWLQPVKAAKTLVEEDKSHALDLETGVFSRKDPRKDARSLKRSAERSTYNPLL
jgi:hypothetical protein